MHRWHETEAMSRAAFQVLVLPYRRSAHGFEYAVFERADAGYWQGIAGGGEDDETPLEAAKREAWEEAGISADAPSLALDSVATMPVMALGGFRWGANVLVIPEHSFGVDAGDCEITLSHEHTQVSWHPYEAAGDALRWDSNKNALWELDYRLRRLAGKD
jgi:dATP pyrophosphohydrolase